jgi:Glyoxalase-like domain
MLKALDLTFDCQDADRMANFWKVAIGYVDEPPPLPFTNRADWIASFGEEVGERVGGAWLIDPAGLPPRLSLLEVPEPKTAKNRLHMDLRVLDQGTPAEHWERVRAEAQRLVAAGATVIAELLPRHVVVADPEGNEFCVA